MYSTYTASSSPSHHLASAHRYLARCPLFSSFDVLQAPMHAGSGYFAQPHPRNEETADQTLSKSFRRCACAGGEGTLGTASPCGEAKAQWPQGSKALLYLQFCNAAAPLAQRSSTPSCSFPLWVLTLRSASVIAAPMV